MTMVNLSDVFKPKNNRDVIIDSDVFNEIDDQFAISYLFANSDRVNIKGITIAPFAPIYNKKVKNTEESIEASYKEAQILLDLMCFENYKDKVYRGARTFLKNEETAVISDAVNFILDTSKDYNSDNRLYIVAIGAITNIASAILLDNTLKDRIAIIWLGGNADFIEWNNEYNLMEDVSAARILFKTEVPLLQVPCAGVVSTFTTGQFELEHFLKGKNKLCDFLLNRSVGYVKDQSRIPTWSRVIWDVVAVAMLINDDEKFGCVAEKERRLPNYSDYMYGEKTNLKMLQLQRVRRDELMWDLFSKLYKFCSLSN